MTLNAADIINKVLTLPHSTFCKQNILRYEEIDIDYCCNGHNVACNAPTLRSGFGSLQKDCQGT